MKNSMSRKEFLKQLSMTGVVVVGGSVLWPGCGSSEEKSTEAEAAKKTDPCADLSGLTPDEISDRDNFEYVAESPYPEKLCDNCALWIEPKPGSPCGGCEIIAGPIHPKGYCAAWVPMEE